MAIRAFRDLSIKWKLTAVMVLTSGLSLCVAGTALLTYELLESRRELKEELSTTADMIATHSTAALAFQDQEAGREILAALKTDERLVGAALYDKSSKLFASFGKLSAGFYDRSAQAGQTVTFAAGHIDLFHPIRFNGEVLGTLHLRASTKSIDIKLERYFLICATVLASSLVIAFFLSSGLRRVISDPILHLAKTAKAISQGTNCDLRAERHSNDEVGTLIDAFNEMLLQLGSREAEIRKHRDHLEEEVNARTADLRLVNRELTVAKEKAEEMARLKSEFLANMSHEIRTPMNGVLGMIELALDTQEDTERRDYLSTAHGCAGSLLQVINDILDFSKMEAGKLVIEAVDLNVYETVYDVMKMLSISGHQKGLELLCDIEGSVPEYVTGDSLRLRQVLVNLLGNAIKFTEAGEVILGVENTSERQESADLHFVITDTGIGIPEKRRQSVFEAFVQVDGSSTRRFGGTGLGLAICAKLVKAMNGEIWVESGPGGRGSAFHFTVRLPRATRRSTAVELPELTDLQGLSVLVVDDSETSCRILEQMLLRWGMVPALARSGESGLEQMMRRSEAGRPFALALLDASMPEMNGFTLAKRIWGNPALAGPPILMLSSTELGDGPYLQVKDKLSAYVVKPVLPCALSKAILEALGLVQPATGSFSPSAELSVGKPLHILVAEDNALNQKMLTTLLKKWQHFVFVVGNGAEAVDFLTHQPCDLVFMDVQMPVMDGYDATRAIRAKEMQSGHHTPIIAFTAHAMKGDRERCLAAGMDDYLSKPVSVEQVGAILKRFCAADGIGLPRDEWADVKS